MKVWTNTAFAGHWPVGTAAVVVAENEQLAAEALNKELVKAGLPASAEPEQFQVLPTTETLAVVLRDGDY